MLIPIVTTDEVPGREISETWGPRGLLAGIGETFQDAVDDLERTAEHLEADAIVALRFAANETETIAYGTAVKLA